MARSGFLGAPGRLPDRWNGFEVAGQRKYRTVGGGVFGLPRPDGTRQDWIFPVTEAYLGGSRNEEPISVIPYEAPLADRGSVAQGRWLTPPEEELGQWPNYTSSVSRPFYEPEDTPERIPLKSSLASLISGLADSVTVIDPSIAGKKTKKELSRGGNFLSPSRAEVKRGYPKTTPLGLVSPDSRKRGLGLDQDPARADFYREFLSEAPRTPLYRDRVSMDYSGGAPAETFPIDWRTGLPSDTPLAARGRYASEALENESLSGDALGFRSQDPGTVSLRPKAIGTEAALNSLEPIIVVGADGIARRTMIDPQIAVDQAAPNPDSTAAFERTKDVLLGERVREIQDEAKTPIMPRSALIQAWRDGRFKPLPQPDGTLVGHLDGKPIFAPMDGDEPLMMTRDIAMRGPYGDYVEQVPEQAYRVGFPLNRDDDFIREELGSIPQLQVRTRLAPQADRPISLAALLSKSDEGFEIVSADTPLLSVSPEGLKARVAMLRQQSADIDSETGRPVNSFGGRLDVYKDGRLLQSIVPEVDQGGTYTGRFLPLQERAEGPSFLLPTTLERIKGEEFGARRGGMGKYESGFEGTLNRLGKGAFMQGPRTADGIRDVIVPLLVSGRLTAEQIQGDPRLSHLFRPGSHARRILDQEVMSSSGGGRRDLLAPLVGGTVESSPMGQSPPNEFWKTWRPQGFDASPVTPQVDPRAVQLGINLSGDRPQAEAARRILRQSGQMSLPVSDLGGQYTPSYVDEVADYMARRAATMPRAGARDRSAIQGEFFPVSRVNPSASAYERERIEPSVRPLGRDELPATQEELEQLGLLAQLRSRSRVFD